MIKRYAMKWWKINQSIEWKEPFGHAERTLSSFGKNETKSDSVDSSIT